MHRTVWAPYIRVNPKHTAASKFIAAEGMNWVKTPPDSADMNPIEMVWHALKDHIQKVAKPTTKSDLVAANQGGHMGM
ncbi:uncharacterized protein LOC120534879 [Tachysurus ichikawai]